MGPEKLPFSATVFLLLHMLLTFSIVLHISLLQVFSLLEKFLLRFYTILLNFSKDMVCNCLLVLASALEKSIFRNQIVLGSICFVKTSQKSN